LTFLSKANLPGTITPLDFTTTIMTEFVILLF
jgi:hypothetical protein